MQELTIIKQNGGAYIDSREVAEAIGKEHKNLLRDIRGYIGVMDKIGKLNFEPSSFFIENTYISEQNKIMPCFLLTKMGCEMVANKLTGDKGVLFTAAYVTKFNEMEAAERKAEIKTNSKPRLGEFNSAVRNVLNGMSKSYTEPKRVMNFLSKVYEPLGISVLSGNDTAEYYSPTRIAWYLGIFSETGRAHGRAVAAIISKLENTEKHMIAVPYGLIGVSMRYDRHIIDAVQDWLIKNNFPKEVPYQGFEYHLYYSRQFKPLDNEDDDFDVEIIIKIEIL